MRKPPTDLKMLKAIYKRYYDQYAAYSDENKIRSAKIWVPIDIYKLADALGTESDILFGRLYYHLNNKYGKAGDEGMQVELFAIRVGSDHHCIHFPLLASILASLEDEN
ncbi:MAG: hypothetical protein GY697_17295 [Desulfobacterales bacterium]|nr:hypothetical protein [Desulfobacterales bacterium]